MNFWKNSKRRDGWRSEIGKKGDISDPGTSCPALVVAWRQKMQLFARLSSQIVGCRLTRAWTLQPVLWYLCSKCVTCVLIFFYNFDVITYPAKTMLMFHFSNFWQNAVVIHTDTFLLVWQSPICQDGNPTNHYWLMGWHVRVLCFPFDLWRTKWLLQKW